MLTFKYKVFHERDVYWFLKSVSISTIHCFSLSEQKYKVNKLNSVEVEV